MAEFPAFSLSPAHVHDQAAALCGHRPCWIRHFYCGGLYSIEHFRICSYCRCIHPRDLIEILARGGGRLEESAKPNKHYLIAPNPIAGDLVRMGSIPIAVFNWEHPPRNLRIRLSAEPSERDATPAERLIGHIERPLYELAPAEILWPFYSEHTTDRQWAEILAAASQGEKSNVTTLPRA